MLEKMLHPDKPIEILSAQRFGMTQLGFKHEPPQHPPTMPEGKAPDLGPKSDASATGKTPNSADPPDDIDTISGITKRAVHWGDPAPIPTTAELNPDSVHRLIKRHCTIVKKVKAFKRKLNGVRAGIADDPDNRILLQYRDELTALEQKFMAHPLYNEKDVLALVKDVRGRTNLDKIRDRVHRLGSKSLNWLYENRAAGGTALGLVTALKIGVFLMVAEHIAHAGQKATGTLPPGENDALAGLPNTMLANPSHHHALLRGMQPQTVQPLPGLPQNITPPLTRQNPPVSMAQPTLQPLQPVSATSAQVPPWLNPQTQTPWIQGQAPPPLPPPGGFPNYPQASPAGFMQPPSSWPQPAF